MSPRFILWRFILVIAIPALAPAFCWGQISRGTILGTVLDPSGNTVPKARVVAHEEATGYERSAPTSTLGDYEFIGLPVGQYSITVEAEGFARESRRDIRLSVQDRLRVDFTLKVGQVTETVTIQSQAPMVEGDSSARGQVIQNRMIVDLPLNGRDFMDLPLLTPGVQTGAPGNMEGNYFDKTIAANGMPAEANEYYVDGAFSTVQFTGVVGVKQSADSLQEFKVMTSTYSAEFGNKAGIHLNLISKSGANGLHGSLFEFIRNDIFDARNFFALGKPEFRRNNFGANAGGPIKKDRLFFYGVYEGTRIRQGATRVTRVPTAAQLNGNLSGEPQIYDPFSTHPDPGSPGQVIRDPIPGNLIPANRLDPITAALAKAYYPAPNAVDPVRNFVSALSVSDSPDIYSGKVDWRINDKHNAFTKYSISTRPRYNPGTFSLVGGDNQLIRSQLASINDTWIISPRTIAEFTVAYDRFVANFIQQNVNKDIPGQAGILGTSRDPFTFGVPVIGISGGGYSGFGDGAFRPNVETDNQYQLTAKVSRRSGGHSLKIGADLRKFAWHQFTDAYFNGNFSFSGTFTSQRSSTGSNSGLAEMLMGIPTSASVSGGLDRVRMFSWSIQPFILDDWQVTRNLTLNLGLRWEFNAPWVEAQDRWAGFDFSTGKAVYPTSANTYGRTIPYPFEQKDMHALYPSRYRNFAPRLGFAYRPFGSDHTALRGGYGIYYNNNQSVDLLNVGSDFPWRLTRSVTSDPTVPQLRIKDALVSTALPPLFNLTFLYRGLRREGIAQQWSFGVQQDLFKGVTLDVSYVGSKHDHFPLYGVNFNQPEPGAGPLQPRRPYPAFNSLTAFMFNSSGTYHALQARAEKRFGKNLGFLTAYSWSRTIDDSEGFEGSRSIDQWKEKALGSMHREHILTTAFNYLAPFGKGQPMLNGLNSVANAVIGGWQVSGILTLQSGSPFNVGIAGDIANCGCTNRPNRIGNGNLPGSQRNVNHWFDASAFTVPAQFTYGNAGRNVVIGPGIQNLDSALFKNFRIREQSTLEFRWELFNALNHANFGFPSATINVPATVGKIFSAAPGRQMQFGLKYVF